MRSPVKAYSNLYNKFTNTQGDICPAGSFCIQGSTEAALCPGGLYCPDDWMKASDSTLICLAGFYCSGGALISTPGGPFWKVVLGQSAVTPTGGDICPKGHYCIQQSSKTTACTSPNFLPYEGAKASSECILCTAGSYCGSSGLTNDAAQCTAGYFCPTGSASSTATRCLQDYYCPTGTYSMKPCAIGQYTAGSGSATCTTCPAGKFCRGTGIETACPTGVWCQNDIQTYCVPGKHMDSATSQTDTSQCNNCAAGHACMQPNIKNKCQSGFYCQGAGEIKAPNDVSTQKGGMCKPAEYSQAGQSSCTQCDVNRYCANYAASSVTGLCWPGFYCLAGSSVPDQNICGAGKYCTGSSAPQDCPPGTYFPGQGATSSQDCIPCPPGTYCGNSGNTALPVTGCQAGYYCNSKSTIATQTLCSPGYKCPAGTPAQIWCEAGTYQPSSGQSVCLDCPAGSYCDGTSPASFKSCQRGFYCPLGTKFANQFPCPAGTFADTNTALTTSSQCKKAETGYYIQFTGQIAQTYQILAGCHGGSQPGQIKPCPYICPEGMYCVQGKAAAMCPDGKRTFWQGATQLSDCIPCQRGTWCKFGTMFSDAGFTTWFASNPEFYISAPITGISVSGVLITNTFSISTWFGNAQNGYLCYEGCTSATPASIAAANGEPCPIGYYCVSGDKIANPCKPGTFNSQLQQGSCTSCTAGYYCPDFAMTVSTTYPCLGGSYCPTGSIYPVPCPTGTINSPAGTVLCTTCTPQTVLAPGATSAAQCLACPAGSYCMLVGQLQATDKCASGFICGGGNDRPGPYTSVYNNVAGQSGKCPTGGFCGSGVTVVTPCAATTYQPTMQNGKCERCPPGYYCTGGAQDKKECTAGFYCSVDSSVPEPTSSPPGGKCPIGYYCPTRSSQPQLCKDGYQNTNITGASSCFLCDSGYVCGNGNRTLCPAYHYCDPINISPFISVQYTLSRLCHGGTYQDSGIIGMNYSSQCLSCPRTKFCTAGRIVGSCAPGYVCFSDADQYQPNITNKAYPCPKGYYCTKGTLNMTRCPPGTWTFTNAAKQISECTVCQMGYYCNYDNINPQECPPGYYCPYDSQFPIPCPVGTYSSKSYAGVIADCAPCPGGYYCNSTAISNLNKYQCPLGYYCPSGYNVKPQPCIGGSYFDAGTTPSTKSFTGSYSATSGLAQSLFDCQKCPEDYYCPKATNYRYKYPCPNGAVCPAGSAGPIPCPPGFYCYRKDGKQMKIVCPEGYFCPMGTSDPQKCGPNNICKPGSPALLANAMLPQDCLPGQYLDQNTCKSCQPGFICEKWTDQRYPSSVSKDGGEECPEGHYCPGGNTRANMVPCPAGTYRALTAGKNIADCSPCPDGSSSEKTGSIVCTVCGSGATNSKDRKTCQCIGAFRTWQESTNSCVCKSGYLPPVYTAQSQTSTNNLDCQPQLAPVCRLDQFLYNNTCLAQSSCKTYPQCGQAGGYYSQSLGGCFCNSASSTATQCDQNCQRGILQAWYLPNGEFYLAANGKSKFFSASVFNSTFDTSGLKCRSNRCQIQSVQMINGAQVSVDEAPPPFIQLWQKQVDPYYKSPYASRKLADGRVLQSELQTIPSSIKCIQPYDSISFNVSPLSYPVYVLQSQYNTDTNYDYGLFTALATKLGSAGLDITYFMVTFTDPGVFVFADVATPDVVQTIVLVTEDDKLCQFPSYPLSESNMELLGIVSSIPKMKDLDDWQHMISPFFIGLAFVLIYIQHIIEKGIESRELEARLKKEGMSVDIKKYFKKSQDKFDKLDYLADLYKLIEQNLNAIREKIQENEYYTQTENRDNMNKMLKDKYSLFNVLKEVKGDTDLQEIRTKLVNMLTNLRFSDGRSLHDLLEEMEHQKLMAIEEEKLRLIEQEVIVSEHDSDESQKSVNNEVKVVVQEPINQTELVDLNVHDDVDHLDDLMRAKDELRRKREEFANSLDKNLTEQERFMMLKRFDDQMLEMERALKREQEEQANLLKAKLAQRKKKAEEISAKVDDTLKTELKQIYDLQTKADKINSQIDEIDENGINTKQQKESRDKEMIQRMKELDQERDRKITTLRNDYLDRIKKTNDSQEKEKLLGEMGLRMKEYETQLNDERKKQDANVMKLLRARQKKNNKNKVKALQKEQEKIYEQIESIKKVVDDRRAQAYSENIVSDLVDDGVKKKTERIANAVDQMFKGFLAETTKSEQEDMQIEKAQLEIAKEKELKAVEVQVEEELDTQARLNKQMLEDQREKLNLQIQNADPEEAARLLAQLQNIEAQINRELEDERRYQARLLEERRKRKEDRLQIRKMRIEMEQVKEISDKEIALNNKKFLQQIVDMDELVKKQIDHETKNLLKEGKHQAMILTVEAYDQILERKQKVLQTKQFLDLSKYLGTLHTQVGMEQMIKLRESKMRFDAMRESVYLQLEGQQLEDQLAKLEAEQNLEKDLIDEQLKKIEAERESELKQQQEERFCQEKKELINNNQALKRAEIVNFMKRYSNDPKVQEIGTKLIKQLDLSIQEEIADLNKKKDEKLERAKMRIIAENDEEMRDLQQTLNEAMAKEERAMNEQLEKRKAEILEMKKQNLEDRLKLAAGDMTPDQIKNLKETYEKEFSNLESAITEETGKQLSNMRSALLQRRIDKERKRKQQQQEEEERKRRESVNRMNAGMAKVFAKVNMEKKAQELNLKIQSDQISKDRLKARLAKWNRDVDHNRMDRGGEEGEVWNLKTQIQELKDQGVKIDTVDNTSVEYTINELYARVLKVENLVTKVKEMGGVDLGDLIDSIDSMSQTINRRMSFSSVQMRQ